MKFNPKKTIYKLVCCTKSGKVYNLTNAILDLTWDDSEDELARKCVVDVFNVQVQKNKWLTSILKLSDKCILYADIGEGPKEILKSSIWDWDYLSASNKVLTLVLYEDSFYLTRSSDNFFKGKGMETAALVSDIGKLAGINIDYQFSSIKHQQIKFQNRKISEMIRELLDEVVDETGEKYMMLMEGPNFVIKKRGGKSNYKLTVENTEKVKHKLSMMDMVTKVKVLSSKSKADEEAGILEEKENNVSEYGEIQAVVTQAKKDKKSSAGSEADKILKEKSKPAESISVENVPDYPFLRKGETIDLKAGDLIGTFYILSNSHNAKDQTMSLELERKDD